VKRIIPTLALVIAPALAFAESEASLGIKVHRQSGISYITGGKGDEAKSFEQVAARYPVQVVFSVGGEHVDIEGVQVAVLDVKGERVIEATAAGPLFYFNPPSGRWTVEARWQGETITRTRDLTGRRYLVLDIDFRKPE
jgi:hypothetical protein